MLWMQPKKKKKKDVSLFFFFVLLFLFFVLFFVFWLFRAAPMAYGSSCVGVELGLQLPAYTTATETQDPSLVCNVHHSSQQH